jgi:peptidoglycan/LPS O-acetylase OafA/YrhL
MGQMKYRYWGALRFFLALLVVLHHFRVIGGPTINSAIGFFLPGTVAVMVFFALSGFIILEAIYSVYSDRPGRFIANRAIRILAPYYPLLIGSIALLSSYLFLSGAPNIEGHVNNVLGWNDLSAENIGSNAFYLWVNGGFPFFHEFRSELLVPFWTVRIEFAFYLVCFAGLCIAKYLMPKSSRPAAIDRVCLAAVIATAFICSYLLIDARPQTWDALYPGIVTFFPLGAAAFLAAERMQAIKFAIPILLVLSVIGFHGSVWSAPWPNFTAQCVLLIGLLAAAYFTRNLEFPAFKAWDVWLGSLSYSLYLTHIIVQIIFKNFIGNGPLVFLAGVIVSLGFAILYQAMTQPLIDRVRDAVRGSPINRSPKAATA